MKDPVNIEGLLGRGSLKGDYSSVELTFNDGTTFDLSTQELRRNVEQKTSRLLAGEVVMAFGLNDVTFSYTIGQSVSFDTNELIKALSG